MFQLAVVTDTIKVPPASFNRDQVEVRLAFLQLCRLQQAANRPYNNASLPTPSTPNTQVLTEEVDRKYANRVVLDVGLAICLYDFVEIGDAYLYPSDGAAHHRGACVRACVDATVGFDPAFIG